jgi:hypothetical protein
MIKPLLACDMGGFVKKGGGGGGRGGRGTGDNACYHNALWTGS